MEFIKEIFNRIFGDLKGFDFWFVASILGIAVVGWKLLSAKKAELKILKRQYAFLFAMLCVATIGIVIHRSLPPKRFTKNIAGILVLRLDGDDNNGSFQKRLVSSLNAELAKEKASREIEVWAADESVSEKDGITEAHSQARAIGERRRALLVIWGNKVSEAGFFPRITVVPKTDSLNLSSERTFAAQDTRPIDLPVETAEQPIYLAHFVTGMALYAGTNYPVALKQFESAQHFSEASPEEMANLSFFAGCCRLKMLPGKHDMLRNIVSAIADFQAALQVFNETNFPYAWAMAQNNLGASYSMLPTGDRAENLAQAVAAYEAALRVRTRKDFSIEWAETQINLGEALGKLPTGDRAANLSRSISAYNSALQVFTEKEFPVEWSTTQNNMGVSYARTHLINAARV